MCLIYVCVFIQGRPSYSLNKCPSLTPVSQGLHSVSGASFPTLPTVEHDWETGFHCPVLNPRLVPSDPGIKQRSMAYEAYLEVSSPRRLGNKNTNRAMETVHGVNTSPCCYSEMDASPGLFITHNFQDLFAPQWCTAIPLCL